MLAVTHGAAQPFGRIRGFVTARARLTATGDPDVDLRLGAVGVAALLGWVSISAVLLGLATGLPVRNQEVVLLTTLLAGAGHAGLGLLPWPGILATRRGRVLLNLWAGALIAGVVGLVLTAGGQSRLDLLFVLVLPWLATLEQGRERVAWLVAAAAAFTISVVLAAAPLSASEALLHAVLIAGAGILGALLSSTARSQARGRAAAIRRAELEGAMLAEGHHRVKNSLQVVADLLLLGRPADGDPGGAVFDQAAARIRSIAAVHDVLAGRSGGRVPADELLAAVAATSGPQGTTLHAEPFGLAFQQAQHLGVVANELITNAHRHGVRPVTVRLEARGPRELCLLVADGGPGPAALAWSTPGLGLRLVRQVVTHGLSGTLTQDAAGTVVVCFPVEDDAHPGR